VDDLGRLCPQLERERVAGGFRFFDAQTDDARMVLRVMQEGIRAGGTAINYTPVEGLLRGQNGRVYGVQIRDLVGGRTAEVKAGVVINATGAWADGLREQVGQKPRLRRLAGSHLIFPRNKFPVNKVISFLHPVDRRPVFAFPWEGVTLFGTTDIDFRDPMQTNPHISDSEISYLMDAVTSIFGCLDLTERDVQSTLSGIRSVLDTGRTDPSKEPRDEILWNEQGLVTITGGKLTMFRRMAQEALNFVRSDLPGHRHPDRRARALDEVDAAEFTEMAKTNHLAADFQLRLLGRYGHSAAGLIVAAHPGEFSRIGESPTCWAEVRWAARNEQVVHLEDLLLRRTRLGLLLPEGAKAEMEQIHRICREELGWDESSWRGEIAAYEEIWRRAYSPPAEYAPQPLGAPSPLTPQVKSQ
jgi:glycerol-3-phosphate dehydrogenase